MFYMVHQTQKVTREKWYLENQSRGDFATFFFVQAYKRKKRVPEEARSGRTQRWIGIRND